MDNLSPPSLQGNSAQINSSTSKYSGASRLVGLAPVIVDIDEETRVGVLVGAGEGDEARRSL